MVDAARARTVRFMKERMFEVVKKFLVGVNTMSLSVRMKRLGCRRVKIMAMPYKKDNTLCSPTSAL